MSLPSSELAPVCRTSGNRIVVVFSHRPGDPTPTPTAQLRSTVQRMNWKISDQSSQSSAGKRVIRMAVDCNAQGEINIYNISTSVNNFSSVDTALRAQLFQSPSGENAIKYLDFDTEVDSENPNIIGQANGAEDTVKSQSNKLAIYTNSAVIYPDGWTTHVTLHELFHAMGATQKGAPGSDGNLHVTDGWDIMASSGAGSPCYEYLGYNQPNNVPIDCGKDTYFNAAPPAGSWLATHWDIGDRENWFLVAPPKATTEAATAVKGKSAVLHGVADSEGTKSSYYFEWGESTSYPNKTPTHQAGEKPVNAQDSISGLFLGHTYHFRLVTTNIDGATSKGQDQVFTTPTPPTPTVTTEAASSVGPAGATLNGTVNPNNTETYYSFEYGKTTSYGKSIPVYGSNPWLEALLFETLLEGGAGVKVSQPISFSVEPNSIYHYRLRATNEAGTSFGQDLTFTTPRLVTPPTFSLSSGSLGAGNGQLNTPWGIDTDSQGNVWVADGTNHRIQKFNSKGEYLLQAGKEGTADGQFKTTRGIAVDAEDNVWVADAQNGRIQKFNSKGEYQSKFTSGYCYDLDIDSKGNIWTLKGAFTVVEYNTKGEILQQWGKEGKADGQFSLIRGIAIDSDDNVWVADIEGNRVQQFNSRGEFLSKFGGGGAGDGQLSSPMGIAIDPKGNLWVTDSGHNRVQEFYPEGEFVSKFGTAGSGAGQFSAPTGIAADPEGNLWVTDKANNRVQKWKQPAPPAVETGAAKSIKRTGASLSATINPEGKATSYQFEWGTTGAFGKVAPAAPKSIGSGSTPVKVSEALSGLKAGTTYYYHVVASGEKGTIYGETRRFKTSPPAGAEAKWRIGGKTLAELAIEKETFATKGSFNFDIPGFGASFACGETGTGTISGTNGAEMSLTLKCQLVGSPKCVASTTTTGPWSGTALALVPKYKEIILQMPGECSYYATSNYSLPSPIALEHGTDAVLLPVAASFTGTFGSHLVYYTISSSWEMTGANTGKTLGLW